MISEAVTSVADLQSLLNELGAASSTLRFAERSATDRIGAVEKWLIARAPRLEVWTPVLYQDLVRPAKSGGKPHQRSVCLGFAQVARVNKLDAWLEAAQLAPVTKHWALVVREDCRTDAGKAVSTRVLRLKRADLDVRLALSLQLDVLVRRIAAEVQARLQHLPTELLPAHPTLEVKFAKESDGATQLPAQLETSVT
jgi:hypothetical protein